MRYQNNFINSIYMRSRYTYRQFVIMQYAFPQPIYVLHFLLKHRIGFILLQRTNIVCIFTFFTTFDNVFKIFYWIIKNRIKFLQTQNILHLVQMSTKWAIFLLCTKYSNIQGQIFSGIKKLFFICEVGYRSFYYIYSYPFFPDKHRVSQCKCWHT